MTTLPSFVELMATLGLDTDSKSTNLPPRSRSSSRSSPASSPRPAMMTSSRHHSRSSSASSSHDADRHTGGRNRTARYCPYSQLISSERRGSLPSLSYCREYEQPLRPYSTSPHPPSSPQFSQARIAIPHLENENPSVSVTDLTANTPISTYVRRRTPQSSPVSPTFPRTPKSSDPPPEDSLMPFSLPTLPYLFPPSASCYSPTSDFDRPCIRNSPLYSSQALPDISEVEPLPSRSYRQTGVRLSTSRPELRTHTYRPRTTPVA